MASCTSHKWCKFKW